MRGHGGVEVVYRFLGLRVIVDDLDISNPRTFQYQ